MATIDRHAQNTSRVALEFFILAVGTLVLATLTDFFLVWTFGRPRFSPHLVFPPAFLASTLLLILGSLTLHRAVQAVRQERQRAFRRSLRLSVLFGSLFMGLQFYGLWILVPANRDPGEASLGVTALVLAVATLHALHFLVAVMFVCFVAARAEFDRYDHEYYWGVVVCAWFWHALTIIWGAILFVFAIAS
jgi:heme/copper-type cytochrome/quinol oxidase subunit 3